ncbi:macrophage colony-stimulating factor 1-like isoform X2 [Festucalex cinctus]
MNTHALDFITKACHLCLFPILCFHLVLSGVPGPCRHSVTQEHLWSLNRLIDNQLDHGCFIIYQFTERLNLSQVCYVKAALPQVLELLRTQFHYSRNSDNRRYVNTLEKALYHVYSQGCISEINEEIEDSPSRLIKMVESSPKEALKKAQHVIQMYMRLMTISTRPVDWNCQSEYSGVDYLNATQVAVTSTTGETDGSHKQS